jgi:hypothetical protein
MVLAALCSALLRAQERSDLVEPVLLSPKTKSDAPWGIRLVVAVVGLAAWYGTQYLIGAKKPLAIEEAARAGQLLTEHDLLLKLTEPINRFLNANSRWANGLLIVSSAIMDLLVGFVLLWSIFGPSFRPFVGLIILFGLRQICQAIIALPPPVGMIWRYPGFPSIFVTYGVSNDLFFSGHTAMAIYSVVELALLGPGWVLPLAVLIALFEIVAVLVLRAHYTMDVFAGLVTALLVAGIAWQIGPACDAMLMRLFTL